MEAGWGGEGRRGESMRPGAMTSRSAVRPALQPPLPPPILFEAARSPRPPRSIPKRRARGATGWMFGRHGNERALLRVPAAARCAVSGLLAGLGLLIMLPTSLDVLHERGWEAEHVLAHTTVQIRDGESASSSCQHLTALSSHANVLESSCTEVL